MARLDKNTSPPPQVDLQDIEGYSYKPELTTPLSIERHELLDSVAGLKPDRSPGPDGIPNRVTKIVCNDSGDEIARLFTACLKIGYHPKAFKVANTVMLKKLGKPSYSDPSAYRPIALLNTMGKVLESVIAKRISKLAETHSLLPDSQYGARPGMSTEAALLNLVEQVHAIWKRDRSYVATALSLDVSKAFDRVSHPRLLHNLRKRRIPAVIRNWIDSFLSDRRTAIRLGGFTSSEEAIQVGIPQGSPISPILYLFYNADLVKECVKPTLNTSTTAFVDDTTILTYSRSTERNCRNLERVHEICNKWSRTHGSKFNVSKYSLLHFSKQRRDDLHKGISIGGMEIQPKPQMKMLGVILDTKLSGKAHLKSIEAKVPALITATKTITGSTWGATLNAGKQVYLKAVRPALTYGSLIWNRQASLFKGCKGRAKQLQALQGKCLRVVAGAYKATATEALEAELGIVPLDLHVDSLAQKAAARMVRSQTLRMIDGRVAAILAGQRRRGRIPKAESPFQTLRKAVQSRASRLGVSLTPGGDDKPLKAIKKALGKDMRKAWEERWESGTKGAHSRRLQPKLDKRLARVHGGLRKYLSALVIQLRTGQIGFNAFLHKRRVPGVNNPSCTHCDSGQDMTVEHVVLQCPKWEALREEKLTGQQRTSLRALLSTRRGCLAAARLVLATRLLAQYNNCGELGEEGAEGGPENENETEEDNGSEGEEES